MTDEIYTLGAWRVREGKEAEFIEAWKQLGSFFRELPHPPGVGTLIQSVDEPRQFYSFGPWPSLESVQEMRANPRSAEEIGKLIALCEEGRPGTFRVVVTM